jgi:CubicO group peptidase (beta-lactamase class C family)
VNSICKLLVPVISALTICLIAGSAVAQTSLDSTLRPYLSAYELPAVAAAVVKDGRIVSAGAVGKRRMDANSPVTINDRFHIGSDTKAFTALVAAMMVEEGRLRWNSTVAEVFPELAAEMDSRLRTVTLEQLLSHTSGIPADNEDVFGACGNAMDQKGNLAEMRYWLVRDWSRRALDADPGAKFMYSNMGYTIAGSMIERASRKTWDELVTERVFIPLQMKTAGLGHQASIGKTDAPLGHSVTDGKITVVLPGPNADAPPVIGPAGIAHMSILDFARWAGWNAGEGKRGPALVKPQTLRKLHTAVIGMSPKKDTAPGTPPGGKYALGWGEFKADWIPYPILFHGGSNGMNLAHIWIDIKQDLAIVIFTNIGGKKADEALKALAKELYGKYKGK